ncbi:MAG: hypothetical protein R6W31_08480, partial [Bacteroidales bacterium]
MHPKFRLLRPIILILSLTGLIFLNVNVLKAQVKLTEESWVIPTYPVLPPDKNPVFFKNEVYQGASKYIYPYALNDRFSNVREDRAWKALIL